MVADNPSTSRIESLDQFRGYTVLGMFVVNFAGSLAAVPALFKHHNTYCSYADTIMPQFLFAVGFAYRMTFLRRLEQAGWLAAFDKALRRCVGLILLGIVVYHLTGRAASWEQLQQMTWHDWLLVFKRQPFETLTHIGVTSLWVLPVIGARPLVLAGYAILSAVLHIWLSSLFYYEWVLKPPVGIDGGMLGFLTWSIPLLVGALAFDAFAAARERPPVAKFLAWGVFLMLLGYALSCLNRVTPPNDGTMNDLAGLLVEPPFVPPSKPVNMWTMSQRAGSAPYPIFGAGFSLALYAVFVLVFDRCRCPSIGLFRTFGSNALAAYLIHDPVIETIKPWTPKDAPLWYVVAAMALFLGITYLFVRYLEKHRIYLRL